MSEEQKEQAAGNAAAKGVLKIEEGIEPPSAIGIRFKNCELPALKPVLQQLDVSANECQVIWDAYCKLFPPNRKLSNDDDEKDENWSLALPFLLRILSVQIGSLGRCVFISLDLGCSQLVSFAEVFIGVWQLCSLTPVTLLRYFLDWFQKLDGDINNEGIRLGVFRRLTALAFLSDAERDKHMDEITAAWKAHVNAESGNKGKENNENSELDNDILLPFEEVVKLVLGTTFEQPTAACAGDSEKYDEQSTKEETDNIPALSFIMAPLEELQSKIREAFGGYEFWMKLVQLRTSTLAASKIRNAYVWYASIASSTLGMKRLHSSTRHLVLEDVILGKLYPTGCTPKDTVICYAEPSFEEEVVARQKPLHPVVIIQKRQTWSTLPEANDDTDRAERQFVPGRILAEDVEEIEKKNWYKIAYDNSGDIAWVPTNHVVVDDPRFSLQEETTEALLNMLARDRKLDQEEELAQLRRRWAKGQMVVDDGINMRPYWLNVETGETTFEDPIFAMSEGNRAARAVKKKEKSNKGHHPLVRRLTTKKIVQMFE